MTTYVLGAGASCDAGYPLAKTMGVELLKWMKSTKHDPNSYAAAYPSTADFLEEDFGPVNNIEDLVTDIQNHIAEYENGSPEQRVKRALIANRYGVFKNAVRAWFAEIQYGAVSTQLAYRDFAENVVSPGDCIITFNYDVSLDRELKLAGKFEVGDGYGFQIDGLPGRSATRILKLHGSTSWLALLFGGMISGFGQFQIGETLGLRPVIGKDEFSFLGYPDAIDPLFTKGGAALPVMIFPARKKDFYFNPNTGIEYVEFWNSLWRQAAAGLQSATRVVICGYSLNEIDIRAREMLLGAPQKNIEILVSCGDATDYVVKEYQNAGYGRATRADEVLFKNFVANLSDKTTAV